MINLIFDIDFNRIFEERLLISYSFPEKASEEEIRALFLEIETMKMMYLNQHIKNIKPLE